MKWKQIAVLTILSLAGCGVPRPPTLAWPAQVASIEIDGAPRSAIESNINDLNSRLGNPILSIGSGTGSPIYIKVVSAFSNSAFGHMAYLGMPNSRGVMSTKIAGRATLVSKQCTIELASFLMDDSAKDLLLPVLWHEIGHCGGLLHVSESGELMSPVTLPFSKYTEAHLERFFAALLASIAEQ